MSLYRAILQCFSPPPTSRRGRRRCAYATLRENSPPRQRNEASPTSAQTEACTCFSGRVHPPIRKEHRRQTRLSLFSPLRFPRRRHSARRKRTDILVEEFPERLNMNSVKVKTAHRASPRFSRRDRISSSPNSYRRSMDLSTEPGSVSPLFENSSCR